MKAMRTLGLAVAGMVCLAIVSVDSADSGEPKKKKFPGGFGAAEIFKKLDTNNDMKLSKEEFSKFGGGKLEGKTDQIFMKLDVNNDGFVTLVEIAAIREFIGQLKNKQ